MGQIRLHTVLWYKHLYLLIGLAALLLLSSTRTADAGLLPIGTPVDTESLPFRDFVVSALPADTNLVFNGDFADGLNDWTIAGDMVASVSSGVLSFIRNASLGSGWGIILQPTGYEAQAGMPFEINVDLGNLGFADKMVSVYIHEQGNWGLGALGCVFTIPANSPPVTHTIRGTLPNDWTNLTFEVTRFDTATAPYYLTMDNVNIQYKPSLGSPANECVKTLPADTNLVRSGDFSGVFDQWIAAGDMQVSFGTEMMMYRLINPDFNWGFVQQQLYYPGTAGMPFEITLDVRQHASFDRPFTVYLHENGTWSEGALGCWFVVRASEQVYGPYTIRGVLPADWSNITLEISEASPHFISDPPMFIDNVDVRYKPSLGNIPTTCVTPPPRDVNLVQNGDFSAGLSQWALAGDMQGTVTDGALNFVRDTSGGSGWSLILQTLNHPGMPGMPFEVQVDLGNTTNEPKDVTVYLHDNGTWASGALGCVFTVPPNTPLMTFLVQGKVPGEWANITLEINTWSPDTAPNYLLMDNVSAIYRPYLPGMEDDCISPPAPHENLISNGDFSNDTTGWVIAGDMFGDANGERLNLGRDASLGNNWGFALQHLNRSLSSGLPIEISFEFESTSATENALSVYLHEAGTWGSGTLGCALTIPANMPNRTYVISGSVPQSWVNATLELSLVYPDPGAGLDFHLDNVNVQYKPEMAGQPFECNRVLPTDFNFIRNGDFSDGIQWWDRHGDMVTTLDGGVLHFVRDANSPETWGHIKQRIFFYRILADSPVEMKVDLGNTSNQAKSVTIYIHRTGTWNYGAVGCYFMVPPNTPLATYTIRGRTPQQWDDFMIEISTQHEDVVPNYLLIDNIDVRYIPSLSVTDLECIEPAPPVVADAESGELSRIEAEDSQVVTASGDWIDHTSDAASGGAYMYSGGTENDTLSLNFSGAQITIVYVQHPALGSFDVYIDGQVVQTVTLTGVQNFGERVLIADLPEGDHTLTIIPNEGVIAVDAFLIGTPP